MEDNENDKKKILTMAGIVVGLMIITLGVSYAFFSFRKSGDNNELIVGDIYMHYKGQNMGVNIDNAIPSETYNPDEYFEFTIEGKNTYTEKDIWYEIDLVYGDAPVDRTIRLRDDLLKFTLFEKVGEDGEETKVLDGVSYESINNTKIWVNKIDKDTTEETKITYKLYMWISNRLTIGRDYTADEWNSNVYASVKVNVKGDFNAKVADEPKEEEPSLSTNMVERLKNLAYSSEKEMIAIDVTDKSNITKCDSVDACKGKTVEYRYSGPEVNNYIYLKGNEGNKEKWRIIGVFKDDKVGEYIKIVRNEVLPESYLPETFGSSSNPILASEFSERMDYNVVYWNFEGKSSDWSKAGLQSYLNSEQDEKGTKGYLSYLSNDTKELLVEPKYFLGAIQTDTTKEAYKHERDVENCVGEKGPSSNNSSSALESENSGCHVWSGNSATWNGKVSLSSGDWDSSLEDSRNTIGKKSWMSSFENTSWYNNNIWLLSPSSEEQWFSNFFRTSIDCNYTCVTTLEPQSSGVFVQGASNSGFSMSDEFNTYNGIGAAFVLPVLALSNVSSWISGDGTFSSPYEIFS